MFNELARPNNWVLQLKNELVASFLCRQICNNLESILGRLGRRRTDVRRNHRDDAALHSAAAGARDGGHQRLDDRLNKNWLRPFRLAR